MVLLLSRKLLDVTFLHIKTSEQEESEKDVSRLISYDEAVQDDDLNSQNTTSCSSSKQWRAEYQGTVRTVFKISLY
jgi:hypothetical protein